jgi:kynureninase
MSDFSKTRSQFHLPQGLIYLDGNSLGPLPLAAERRVARTLTEEWGNQLIGAWNQAGWMDLPRRLGDRIARLIGARKGSVVLGDTLSIKVFQALAAGLAFNPERKIILSDSGNFPSDLYIAEGLSGLVGGGCQLKIVDPDDIAAALCDDVAVLLLTQVDYRTGRLHDMAALTRKAHDFGVMTVWDLAHSAGAMPIDLAGCDVDFAVGCTYKYLNGGPGAPAFIYVAPRLADRAKPALSGWLGHQTPFAFDLDYRPAAGIERMRVGTPPIIALAALDAALDIWDGVDLGDVRQRSLDLGDLFIAEIDARCPSLVLATPREREKRGSQVSFRHPDGYTIMRALIERGVIGDFREPDIIRFGLTPLYIGTAEIMAAVDILADLLDKRLWDQPLHRERELVT